MKDMSFYHKHKIEFMNLGSVNNPKSIHGIYPYRGKISALDAAEIIKQLPKDAVLLDPFCGSGTIVYEAQKHGMNAIGVELNPLAVTLSKAKTTPKSQANHILEECERIIIKAKNLSEEVIPIMPTPPANSFHEDTAKEICRISVFEGEMTEYVKAAYFGAIALTARGCNHYKWTSSTVGKNIEPKRYINFYEKLSSKCKKHLYLNEAESNAEIISADARELSKYIKPNTVDVVFTSPPYFDGLDYTAYYAKLIYEMQQVDRKKIKEKLIQKVGDYYENMQRVLDEIEKVTTDDAIIIFVVGDKKVKGELISGGEYFSKVHYRKPSYIMERGYTGSSSQIFDKLNKTQRKEQIVVWDKQIGMK